MKTENLKQRLLDTGEVVGKGIYDFSKDLARLGLVFIIFGGIGWCAGWGYANITEKNSPEIVAVGRDGVSVTVDNKYNLYFDPNSSNEFRDVYTRKQENRN